MKKNTIGLSAFGFIDWNGGLDYFINIVRVFQRQKNCNFIVYIPDYRYINPIAKLINKNLADRLKRTIFLVDFCNAELIQVKKILPFSPFIMMSSYIDGCMTIGPLIKKPWLGFIIPWFSFIFDYQHKYLGHYFSYKDITKRDIQIANLAIQSNYIFVGSRNAKSYFLHYYIIYIATIFFFFFIIHNNNFNIKNI